MGTYVTRYLDLDDWMLPNDEDLWDDDSLGTYEAFIPTVLADLPAPSSEAMTLAAQAERELGVLDDRVSPAVGLGPIEWLLLRTESISSTHIEGIACTTRDLMMYEETGTNTDDGSAVRGVAEASHRLWESLKEISSGSKITVEGLSAINEAFLLGTPSAGYGGELRETQNWIGRPGSTLATAAFVPPPPDEVERLMEDLVDFCNDAHLPAVAVAAMAHAQFETIHPFADGNGRTGRALIQMVLRARGVMNHTVLPVSTVLSADRDGYIDSISSFQAEGKPDPSVFVTYLSRASIRAARLSMLLQGTLAGISSGWREKLKPRRGSAVDALIDILPYRPMVKVAEASKMTGISERNVREGLRTLAESGILTTHKTGRESVFAAEEVIEAMRLYDRKAHKLVREG